MHLEEDHQPAGAPFLATDCGIALTTETTCEHDQPAFALRFLGTWPAQTGPAETELDVLLPRCVSAQLVGALAAFVTHHDGNDAGKAFLDQAGDAYRIILQQLRDVSAQGREHTCTRKDA